MWPELLPQLCNLLNSEDYNTCEVGDRQYLSWSEQGMELRVGLKTVRFCLGSLWSPTEDL